MKKLLILLVFGMLFSGFASAEPIIADHNAVDEFDQIPQDWIDEVKKMLVCMPGESHSTGLKDALQRLEDQDSTYAYDLSNFPSGQTDQYLRQSVFYRAWGTSWSDTGGEEDMWTHQDAIDRLNGALEYQEDTGNGFDAFGFVWCFWEFCDEGSCGVDEPWVGRAYTAFDKSTSTFPWDLNTTDPSMQDYLNAWEYLQTQNPQTTMIYTTGPLDDCCRGLPPYSCDGYQRYLRNEYIRNWVRNSQDRVLFDYADILAWNDAGFCSSTWQDTEGIFGSQGEFLTHPLICEDNLNPVISGHISATGQLRLAKAMWWMLARIAGWEGVQQGDNYCSEGEITSLNIF
jgi:hypothetical protein